jgi:hypothetical protein
MPGWSLKHAALVLHCDIPTKTPHQRIDSPQGLEVIGKQLFQSRGRASLALDRSINCNELRRCLHESALDSTCLSLIDCILSPCQVKLRDQPSDIYWWSVHPLIQLVGSTETELKLSWPSGLRSMSERRNTVYHLPRALDRFRGSSGSSDSSFSWALVSKPVFPM